MKTLEEIRQEISKMPLTEIIDELARYKMKEDNAPKITITPEQFHKYFKVKGYNLDFNELRDRGVLRLENRGRKSLPVDGYPVDTDE